jgi:hypothetical protein
MHNPLPKATIDMLNTRCAGSATDGVFAVTAAPQQGASGDIPSLRDDDDDDGERGALATPLVGRNGHRVNALGVAGCRGEWTVMQGP